MTVGATTSGKPRGDITRHSSTALDRRRRTAARRRDVADCDRARAVTPRGDRRQSNETFATCRTHRSGGGFVLGKSQPDIRDDDGGWTNER